MDVQLLVYVVGVGLHGGHGHEQLLGDLGRVLFLDKEQQDVRLAFGEGVLHGNGGADLAEGVVVRHRVGSVATGALHPPRGVVVGLAVSATVKSTDSATVSPPIALP